MNTLDLTTYGVEEMTQQEMVNENGGGAWGVLFREIVREFGIDQLCESTMNVISGIRRNYEYDPTINYTPWAGPIGGGFK